MFVIYANEVERGRLDIVAAGLAVWLADWFNEILNSVILEVSDRAPLWATTGPTAYQFLVGLNVEISFMFALGGIVYAKFLPADRSVRILGMPNRLAIALGMSLISVLVELFLHETGHVPLGLLVVEHAVRPADLRLRLPVVLPLRRVGLRRAGPGRALAAPRRAGRDQRRDGARVRRGAGVALTA